MGFTPNAEEYARSCREVQCALHPEHIPGAGPEQDYLSRFYAPSWTHIGVAFNYQLHHVFIVLEAWLQHIVSGGHKEVPWVPERLEMELQDLCIVHFSGELKMWDRDYFSDETDEDFATRVLRDCSYKSAQLWLDKTAQDWEYDRYGLRLDENKDLLHGTANVSVYVDLGVRQAVSASVLAAKQWREDFESLPLAHSQLPTLPELVRRLRDPGWPSSAVFERGARVEMWWPRTKDWFPGKVVGAHEGQTYSIVFDEPGDWGTGARGVSVSDLRRIASEGGSAVTSSYSEHIH